MKRAHLCVCFGNGRAVCLNEPCYWCGNCNCGDPDHQEKEMQDSINSDRNLQSSYDADRTLQKCDEVLRKVSEYLTRQSEMNAALHLSERVVYSPLLSAVDSTLIAIDMYRQAERQ